MNKNLPQLHSVAKAYVIIFVFWGLYRLVFRLPEEIEETLLKPMVFIGAVLFVERPKRWLNFFCNVWGKGDIGRAGLLGLLFGLGYVLFYGIASFLTFGSLSLGSELANSLWVSFVTIGLATAVWEEWVFAGYIYQRLAQAWRSVWPARLTTAVLFALVHAPILIFWYKFTGNLLLFQLTLLFVLGLGNTVLMGLSKNLLAPILSHALWGIAIYFFR